jgi:hypothetical protein
VHGLLIRLSRALGVWLVAIAVACIYRTRHGGCPIFRSQGRILSWVIFCEEWSDILLRQFRQSAGIAGRLLGIGLCSVFSVAGRRARYSRGELGSGLHPEGTRSDYP